MEERGSETIERWSAQTIFQRLAVVRDNQYIVREYEGDKEREKLVKECREHMEELQDQLRVQIQIWGGIETIDRWLKENDLGHSVPSEIEEMDWSWLEQVAEESSSFPEN